MIRKFFAFTVLIIVICVSITSCKNINSESTTFSVEDVYSDDYSDKSSGTEFLPEQNVVTKSETILGVDYKLTGVLLKSSIFVDGPHYYTFDHFSVKIDVYSDDIDFDDENAVNTVVNTYICEKEACDFVVSDLDMNNVDIKNLEHPGVVINFNCTSDDGNATYYKTLMFNLESGATIYVEFCSSYDGREELINKRFDSFLNSLEV